MKVVFCVLPTLLFSLGAVHAEEVSEFQRLTAEHEERCRKLGEEPFARALLELNARYLRALDGQRSAAQNLGKLDESLALQAESKLVAAEKPVPPLDASNTPASLVILRKTYRTSYQGLGNERKNVLKIQVQRFADSLNDLKLRLTKAGNLTEAQKIADKLAKLELDAGGHEAAAVGEASAVEAVRRRIAGTRWSWIHAGTEVAFFDDGHATISGQDFYNWEISANDVSLLEVKWSGRLAQLRLSKDLRSAKAVLDGDREWTARNLGRIGR